MHRIISDNIDNAKKYIKDISSIYFINILTGSADGIIWGDKEVNPELLVIWSDYEEGFQLMGKTIHEKDWGAFYQWFEEVIIPFMKSKGIETFEYGVDNDDLSGMMDAIFVNKNIEWEKQKIFYYDGNVKTLAGPIEYQFEKIDQEIIKKNHKNMNYLTDEIQMAYGSYDNYLKNGYGYAALKDNEIVARSLMTFNYENKSNISVDTIQLHRNKGLSSYLVSKTIQEALRRNQIPIWDCSEDNIASEKTALRCGFKMIREDNVYWFSI